MTNQKISIIIPVYNETLIINSTILHLLNQDFKKNIEIIVVDSDPNGATTRHIRYGSVMKVISQRGRGRQMNAGAARSTGEILLFLHADSRLHDDAFYLIRQAFENKQVDSTAFVLAIRSPKKRYRLIEKGIALRQRLNHIPYGDQGIAVRKDVFFRLGGYRDIPIMEDVDLIKRLKKHGYRLKMLPEKIETSPRRWETEGIIYCTVRNWLLILLYTLGVPAQRLARFYE